MSITREMSRYCAAAVPEPETCQELMPISLRNHVETSAEASIWTPSFEALGNVTAKLTFVPLLRMKLLLSVQYLSALAVAWVVLGIPPAAAIAEASTAACICVRAQTRRPT